MKFLRALKTGWLVKSSPYLQQYGQLIAAGVACWVIAAVVITLGKTYGFGDDGLAAPQARLMKTMIEAVLGANLPWDLLLMGGLVSGTGILVGLPALPFALGIYLPLSTLAAVFVGGCARRWVERGPKERRDVETGVLCASGFVAGEGLAGVLIAGYAYATDAGRAQAAPYETWQGWVAMGVFGVAVMVVRRASMIRG